MENFGLFGTPKFPFKRTFALLSLFPDASCGLKGSKTNTLSGATQHHVLTIVVIVSSLGLTPDSRIMSESETQEVTWKDTSYDRPAKTTRR